MPVGFAPGDSDFGTIEATGGSKTVTLNVNQIPSHRHNVKSTNGKQTATDWWGSGTSLTVQTQSYGGSNPLEAVAVGGGQAHNNRQPDQTCYIWKRTV